MILRDEGTGVWPLFAAVGAAGVAAGALYAYQPAQPEVRVPIMQSQQTSGDSLRITLPAGDAAPALAESVTALAGDAAPRSGVTGNFLDGLASSGDRRTLSAAAPKPVPTERVGNVDLMSVAYALPGTEGGGSKALSVEKKLVVQGHGTGAVRIHLYSGSHIEVDRDELFAVLEGMGALDSEAAGALGIKPGQRSFAELRKAGLDIGYDAITDRMVLSGLPAR